MTNREKAIVSAYTGVNMLLGTDIKYYYEYLEELYEPEFWLLNKTLTPEDIKKRSEHDFLMLCKEDNEK